VVPEQLDRRKRVDLDLKDLPRPRELVAQPLRRDPREHELRDPEHDDDQDADGQGD
jgi:hypothetical protein